MRRIVWRQGESADRDLPAGRYEFISQLVGAAAAQTWKALAAQVGKTVSQNGEMMYIRSVEVFEADGTPVDDQYFMRMADGLEPVPRHEYVLRPYYIVMVAEVQGFWLQALAVLLGLVILTALASLFYRSLVEIREIAGTPAGSLAAVSAVLIVVAGIYFLLKSGAGLKLARKVGQ